MKKLFDNEFFHAGNCAENVTISIYATSKITFVSFGCASFEHKSFSGNGG